MNPTNRQRSVPNRVDDDPYTFSWKDLLDIIKDEERYDIIEWLKAVRIGESPKDRQRLPQAWHSHASKGAQEVRMSPKNILKRLSSKSLAELQKIAERLDLNVSHLNKKHIIWEILDSHGILAQALNDLLLTFD